MKPDFLFVRAPTNKRQCLNILRESRRRHLPILDAEDRLTDIFFSDYNVLSQGVSIVLMVGGQGTRLGELTKNTPKPMLPLGDKPMLEHIVCQLRDQGFRSFYFCTNFQSEVIQKHFKGGEDFGVEIQYTEETQPLGTAGGLSLLRGKLSQTFIVMNGDVITNVSFNSLMEFHFAHEGEITVAAKDYCVNVPYGVIEVDRDQISGLTEKPSYRYFTNAGIYVMDPETLRHVPDGQAYNMTELIQKYLSMKKKVGVFPLHEGWIDVGRPEDYFNTKKIFER